MAHAEPVLPVEEDSIEQVALACSVLASHCDHMQRGGGHGAEGFDGGGGDEGV